MKLDKDDIDAIANAVVLKILWTAWYLFLGYCVIELIRKYLWPLISN
jgi:hypothetical protein